MTAPRLTREQAAIVGVYTGIVAGPVVDIHELAEELMGRPVLTHELADLNDELRNRCSPLFRGICAGGEG